jgi:hypothetical protein
VEARPYRAIDRHALATPPAVENSLASLAKYLTQPARDEREKARAIFRWVADRIAYDAEGYFSGEYGDLSAAGVLQRRKAVCEGYANLFLKLCQQAGLTAAKIHGYARGADHVPGAKVPKSNHAWNAVKLQGKWHLLDVTWGAGHLRGKDFVKQYNDYFFLPAPDKLIFSHLPEAPRWQLLSRPVARAEFGRQPWVSPLLFRYGFSAQAVRQALQRKDFRGLATVFSFQGNLTVRQAPLSRHLRAGTEYRFRVESPDALAVAVINGTKWHPLTRDGRSFEGALVPAQGNLGLAVRLPGEKSYWTVLQYVVEGPEEAGPTVATTESGSSTGAAVR